MYPRFHFCMKDWIRTSGAFVPDPPALQRLSVFFFSEYTNRLFAGVSLTQSPSPSLDTKCVSVEWSMTNLNPFPEQTPHFFHPCGVRVCVCLTVFDQMIPPLSLLVLPLFIYNRPNTCILELNFFIPHNLEIPCSTQGHTSDHLKRNFLFFGACVRASASAIHFIIHPQPAGSVRRNPIVR